jgi:hypothetical protein
MEPSRLHLKVESASDEENEKLADVLFTYPEGPESIVVPGGVASTIWTPQSGLSSLPPEPGKSLVRLV